MKQTIFISLLMLLPIMAWADDSGDCGENAAWTYEESTKTLTISGSGALYDFVVSDHEYVRTKWLSLVIQTIIIEDGVTSLGHEAFAGFNNLTSVTIGNDVKSIGYWTFSGCSNLTTISIPNSVTSIDPYAFQDCSSLTSIIIPVSVTSIGDQAFYNCSSLATLTILSGVTSIGSNAFSGCSSITEVHLGIKKPFIINQSDFPNRANATLYVPYGSKKLYEKASVWQEFKAIVEPDYDQGTCGDNVTYTYDSKTHFLTISGTGPMEDLCDEYGWYAAPWDNYKNEIEKVIIENGVTSIGGYTFYDCSGLTSVTIPDGVTIIGPCAFSGCI